MPKGLIVFIVVASVALGATLIIQVRKVANDAHKQSDEILKKFRTINNSLQKSSLRIDSPNNKLFESLDEKLK